MKAVAVTIAKEVAAAKNAKAALTAKEPVATQVVVFVIFRENAVKTALKDAEDFNFQFSFHKPV